MRRAPADKRIRTDIKSVLKDAKLRLVDEGVVYHMSGALDETKRAYYIGKLAAWKDAAAYLKKEARGSVEVARVAEDIQRMINKVERDVRKCE